METDDGSDLDKFGSEKYLPSSYCMNWEQFNAAKEWLFPMTEEIEGVIFLSGRMVINPEARSDVARAFNKNPNQVTKEAIESFNWIEADGFIYDDIPDGDVISYLEILRSCWQWAIQTRHPDHQIVVRILPPEETGGWFGVGFEQMDNQD